MGIALKGDVVRMGKDHTIGSAKANHSAVVRIKIRPQERDEFGIVRLWRRVHFRYNIRPDNVFACSTELSIRTNA